MRWPWNEKKNEEKESEVVLRPESGSSGGGSIDYLFPMLLPPGDEELLHHWEEAGTYLITRNRSDLSSPVVLLLVENTLSVYVQAVGDVTLFDILYTSVKPESPLGYLCRAREAQIALSLPTPTCQLPPLPRRPTIVMATCGFGEGGT
ncbi:hypothetical protein DPEC_G00044960 [Dallia pectoralis]|uniref:Uncharacterized protein n=1 Tax=Dallia pectoralis TaxID=75939 RepID=A0ACC2H9T1_DALPE|nr:hypothetical protein DPEC_G00044960 [Dallia pectoralis]